MERIMIVVLVIIALLGLLLISMDESVQTDQTIAGAGTKTVIKQTIDRDDIALEERSRVETLVSADGS